MTEITYVCVRGRERERERDSWCVGTGVPGYDNYSVM